MSNEFHGRFEPLPTGTGTPSIPAEENSIRNGHAAHRQRMTGRVKFFNAEKGYGIVYFDDRSIDAFLHATALREFGLFNILPEATVHCEIEVDFDGRRKVVRVISVDASTVPMLPPEPRYPSLSPRRGSRAQTGDERKR